MVVEEKGTIIQVTDVVWVAFRVKYIRVEM
jgi:hypothetical protein